MSFQHDHPSTSPRRSGAPPPPPVRLMGDVACPWTHLALHALAEAFGDGLRLEWHPFLLNLADLARQRRRLAQPVARYAATLGVPFEPLALGQSIDTRLAHALILAAGAEGRTFEAASALFQARFGEGRVLVTDEEMTDALAARVGAGDAARWLQSTTTTLPLVERAARAARLAGVSEIPLAVIDGAFVIGGLQPPEAYRALVDLAHIRDRLHG